MISGNAVGGTAPIKTVKLIDENGVEILGVVTESEVIFTATDNDVREGVVYASDNGVSTGTKNIPSYHTSYGCRVVSANKDIIIPTTEYNYSNLFVIISTYSNNVDESTITTYVSIDNGMYAVGSSAKLSDIIIDTDNEEINLGLTTSEKSVVRYLVTMEEF